MKKIYLNTLSIVLVAMFLSSSWQLAGQISFTNRNDLLTSTDWHSGVGLGTVDMNNDKLVDILRLDQGNILTVEYQVEGGMFVPYTFGSISNQSQWSLAAGDADNNGYNDVICGDYDYTKIIMANADGTDYSFEELPGPAFFAQGTNFADINNDGWVDVFVCDDNSESEIFANNGDGTFSEADNWIDMATDPPSDNSGNYGSIWTDFDNDGDLDLYIAKCRQGVGDPTDPRRINALFVNDGNNNYTERADEYGLKIGWQSWTSDFNDIDNDGDMDCFLTNHDFANMLMENDGTGFFRDISTGQDIGITTTSFPIQGLMRDFDNDGFVDILVSGNEHHLYRNNGDKTFTEIDGLFDNNEMESFAVGDLNNDGFLDIYGGYANIYTNPSNIDDVIWMNDGNDNNWFAIDLIGTVSNSKAIGARIEIYGDWGVQIREVRAGESYGIMNSLKQNFGLGQATSIDHLIIKWPSGAIDVIENPAINSTLCVTETSCEPFSVEIEAMGNTIICEGESVDLSAPAGYNYIWSNGATGNNISVGNAGNYNVVVENIATGCYGISQNITVEYEPDETPEVEIAGDLEFCDGGYVTLTASEANSYMWSNGETSQSIEVTEPGEYFVTTEGVCSENSSESVIVTVLDADVPVADDVQITSPGPAMLIAVGDNPQWYDAEIGGNLMGEGDTLFLTDVQQSTYYWVQDIVEHSSPAANVGMESHAGSDYSGEQWNGGIIFNAMESFTLNSVKVYSDTEGERLIELIDGNGSTIESLIVDIPETGDDGMYIDLDFEVPVGNGLILTTNEDYNNTILGYNSPRLKRASSGVNYNDYMVDGLVNITGSSIGGSSRYYYFFDWDIQPISIFCQSDRVDVFVELVNATQNINETAAVDLFPNPTNGQINLKLDFEQDTKVNVIISDLTGKQVYSENIGTVTGVYTEEMNLSHLAKGIYLVQVATAEHTYFGKIAIQ